MEITPLDQHPLFSDQMSRMRDLWTVANAPSNRQGFNLSEVQKHCTDLRRILENLIGYRNTYFHFAWITSMKYRIITADSWPGPEDQGVFSMVQRHEKFIHSALLSLVSRSDFDAAVAKQVQKIGDPGGDAYDIASTKVWLAAWILVMHKLCSDSAIEIPLWLAEEYAIVMSGRYPLGYTDSSQGEMLVLGS